MANANIFAQYVKPVRSMQDYANDYDVAEQNKLALAAKRMEMQRAQRGEADAQTMRGIAQQYGGDENALIRAYRQGGFLDQAAGLEKSISDRLKAKADADKTGADTRKSDAETQAKGFELAKNRYNQYRMALGALAGDPALGKEKVIGVAGGLVDAGILTPELAQKLAAQLPDDPEALRAYIISGRDAQLSPEQQSKLFAPEFSWQDSGQQKIPVQVNPRAPNYTPPQTIQKVETPDSVAGNFTSTENNKRTVEAAYANAAAGRAQANATRDAARITADSKRAQDAEMKLADDYRTESKGWAETATAIGMVKEALKTADKNPGSALAAGTKFMKLLDPTSVVRETELGMALNASGWFDRATNVANQLQSGRVMTKEQVKNLGAAGDALYEEARKAQLQIDAAFEARAKAYGANPANVITDRGQRSPRNAPAPADPSGWSATKVN